MEMMDRRGAVVTLLGLAGATISYRWSQGGRGCNEPLRNGQAARAVPALRQAGPAGFKSMSVAQLPLGGGGFVTGLDVSADGQRFLCRTDVCNAYVRNAGEPAWKPLFSPATMLVSDYDPLPDLNGKADGQGVAGIRIAPSNKDIIFASYYGFIWKSVDGGRTVRRTRLSQKPMPSNAGFQRLFNRTIDVHPREPRQIVVGTYGDGAWYSLDGGDRWERATLPPAGSSKDGKPGIHLILYDPNAADRLYVFVTGVGLYRSDFGPAGAFVALTGGPRFCSNLVAAADGTIYLCEQSDADSGRIWRYAPAAGWSSAKPEHEALVIAANPHRPNELIAANANGYFMISEDGGTSFASAGGSEWNPAGGEVSWIGGLSTMFPAELKFDPGGGRKLWIAQGVGVATSAATKGKIRTTDWSAGIEELCAVAALSVPGGKTFLSAWDKPFWRLDDPQSYANNFRYPLAPNRCHDASLVSFASFLDYAADDPNFLVGVVAPSDNSAPGYSSDGGETWSLFEGRPTTGWGYGGCIAASTKDNIVLLPSNNGIGVFTLDGGKNWSPIRLDQRGPTGAFANAFYVTRKNLSADKTRPGTFALVYSVIKGNEFGDPLGGVWLTTDGGRSWNQKLKGVINEGSHSPAAAGRDGQDNRQFWQCQLEYVPGFSGELMYTPHADYRGDRFWWSQDDGLNWTELHPAVRNVTSFGFGKALVGHNRPAVYFWGEVKGVLGLYASFDWFGSTPLLLTRFPSQMLAKVSHIAADRDHFGRAYVGTSCAGWVQVDIY